MADRILLGITGSVAAFKGVALASMMSREGCEVDCILSSGGLRFVTPWQVSGVTGRPCRSELFDDTDVAVSPHLELTESVELMVVAPASADFLARLAAGLAGQLLTAAALAYEGPLVAAPAMNERMWASGATRKNVEMLRERGVVFVGPVEGRLGCGDEGQGRMAEPEDIWAECKKILRRPGRT
jgi:phosphopantothenoylcysteine decarboxylase/phosphopantothenate--cysteine ligase